MGSLSSLAGLKVAAFGAGGFIGSHTIETLIELGCDILAIDITLEKLADIPTDDYRYIQLDVTKDRDEVEDIIKNTDIVIDLIAFANPSLYVSDPIGTVDLNLFENLRIVDLCLEYDKFLIQYSTCEVYGVDNGRNEAFNEDETLLILGPINEQRWIYSCAKQMLERMVHAYGQKRGLNYIIIRPFNFVGPKIDYLIRSQDEGNPRVFSHFMSALLLNKPLPLVDGGRNLRSYTYIKDAMEAFKIILANRDKLNRQIVNIGNPGNETSIKQLAELMIRLYEEEADQPFTAGTYDIPGREFYGEGYADCDRRIPDASKLFALDWQPTYDLETTFRESMRYYLKHNDLVEV